MSIGRVLLARQLTRAYDLRPGTYKLQAAYSCRYEGQVSGETELFKDVLRSEWTAVMLSSDGKVRAR